MESKISFGFKKLPKKSAVIGAKPPEENKVELIECLDASNIKIIGHVEEEKKDLVIPMQGANKTLLDRINDANDLKERSLLKHRPINTKLINKKEEVVDLRPDAELTIDELAARKLLEEAKNYEKKTTAVKVSSIAIEDQLILEGAKESTMDDYEAVPIGDFGMAMLRGMGWSEEQGAGKKKVEAPQLRPKGMGLGASVPGNTRNKIPLDKDGKELKLVKDAKARIIAGKEKGNYCIVQGLDDDSGRVVVKTTLAGTILSLNEFMLFPVSNDEYAKCSKVLNSFKFEKFKEKSEQTMKNEDIKNGKYKESKDDDSVQHIPNGKPERIELSSESEGEREKYKQQNTSHKVKVKQERRSRSKSRERNRHKEDRISSKSSRNPRRSRSRSTSRNRSNQRRERTISRSRSRSRTKKTSSRHKSSGRSKDRAYSISDSDDVTSNDDYKHKRRDKKTKKSKKHKRDKKSKKEKKKSKRRSSSSDSYSSETDDYSSSKTKSRR